jgi:segregation and condensation protein B
MDFEQMIVHVEALVFASQQPITASELLEHMSNVVEAPIDSDRMDQILAAIQEKYDSPHYPFALMATGGGYQFLTKTAFHQTIMQLNGDKFIKKLSAAAMETLSIIAYKQPVTKAEIEFIRGVSADYSIQKLLEKELIVIAGRNEEAVGKPLIYATSKHFMDYLGINSPSQLPQLKEVANMEIVFPTEASEAVPEMEQQLAVDAEGNLNTIE